MLTLLWRRTVAQGRLLVGIVVLVAVGSTLLGVGALLLGVTQERAFAAGMAQVPDERVDVTAFLVGVGGSDVSAVRQDAAAVVERVLGPLHPSTTTTTVSRMRRLVQGDGIGYLSTTDSLDDRAELTGGRWVRGAGEVVVPDAAAERLGLAVGGRFTLGAETGTDPVDDEVPLTVVGTFRASSRAGWVNDPLGGRGVDADYSDGTVTAPAYGPFVVDEATFVASGSTADALQVSGHPALANVTESSVARSVTALRSADGLLSARTADEVDISRVASDLPETLEQVRAQQSATRSTVLVVLLLGTTMALAALLLAGQLLAKVREAERSLLAEMGLSRRQTVAMTSAETLAVALAATAIAVPCAAAAHSALTRLPSMRAAGLDQGPTVTSGLVLTGVASAILLGLALAVPLLLPGRRVASGVRSGLDAVLVLVAVAGWWELRSQPSASASGDAIRTIAPVVCIVAVTVVSVRVVPRLLTVVARVVAVRSTALVLPLASSQAARRTHAGAALVLLATAAASATFGLSLQSTWQRSQGDQADLRTGADLALTLAAPPTRADAVSIADATRGAATSAVTDRPLVLGRYVGDPGSPPVLVAVDSRRAGALLRGRLDGATSWSRVGSLLAAGGRAAGPDLSAGDVTIEGSPLGEQQVEVVPTLVVQDASGLRSAVRARPVTLDGRAHRLVGLPSLAGAQLVGVSMTFGGDRGSLPDGDGSGGGVEREAITLTVEQPPGVGAGDGRPAWVARVLDAGDSPISGAAVVTEVTSRRVTLTATVQLDPTYLAYSDGELLLTAFAAPDVLPVAVSQRLADVVGTKVGGRLQTTVDGVDVPIQVVAVVPDVPSAPGRVAVLADEETLSRMLVAAGSTEPAVDAFWVSDPSPTTVAAMTRLDLGDVVTREDLAVRLRQGPLRASVPAVLELLVVASGLFVLGGVALAIGAERRARSAEVARLRAVGVTRRQAVRLGLAEHGMLLGLLVLTGAVVGVGASWLLGPGLVRSDLGAAPAPAAVLVWPWVSEIVAVATMSAACLATAAVIAVFVVRRSGPEQLRAED